jgi:hypothetical protein
MKAVLAGFLVHRRHERSVVGVASPTGPTAGQSASVQHSAGFKALRVRDPPGRSTRVESDP